MPVASCVSTGTAPRAAIRSLLAREGFPPQAPLPQRALSNGRALLLLQEGLAVSHGTGRYARERIQCHGRWREKIRSLWMKHIWRRDARELNVTEGGRRPLTGISSKDKGGYSPPQRLPLESKRPRRFPVPGALASKTKGQPTDWRRTSRRPDAGRCARRTGAHSPAGCGRG